MAEGLAPTADTVTISVALLERINHWLHYEVAERGDVTDYLMTLYEVDRLLFQNEQLGDRP
jgi:hypothetical protein